MCDVPSSVIFCSSVILMLPGICLMYFSEPFFICTSDPITTGIVVAFIPHIRSISISRSLYFDSFSVTLTDVFFSAGLDISMDRQLFSCLSFITMSGLLDFISLSVCIGLPHKIVILSFSVTVWGSCSYHFSSTFIFSSLQMFQCSMWRLYHVCVGIQFWPAARAPCHVLSMVSWN